MYIKNAIKRYSIPNVIWILFFFISGGLCEVYLRVDLLENNRLVSFETFHGSGIERHPKSRKLPSPNGLEVRYFFDIP